MYTQTVLLEKVKKVRMSCFKNCIFVVILHLFLTENNIPWTLVIIISGALAFVIVLSVICTVIYVIRRRSKNSI